MTVVALRVVVPSVALTVTPPSWSPPIEVTLPVIDPTPARRVSETVAEPLAASGTSRDSVPSPSAPALTR